ncbi:MAG: flagellar basal body P-ring formation chaperone FlgA [Planctomycetota bacterium]
MHRPLIMLMLALLLATPARADTAITLRSAARIDAGTRLTIGDIATVSGNAPVATLPISAQTDQPGRITVPINTVRQALETAGIARSEVTIRGDRCIVIVRESRDAASLPQSIPAPKVQSADTGERTIRDHVRAAIERSLGVSGDALRLGFDPSDAEQLRRATAGMTVDVHATGIGRRTPARITLYHADGSIEVVRVRVEVQIRRAVARLTRNLPRGASVGPNDIAVSHEWLAPDEPHIEPAVALGQRLRRALDTGDRLTDASVEPPIVIERGDIVMVHVVSGTVVLRRESRAIESGRVGQRIRLEPLSGGRVFRAAIEGPGRAVIMTNTIALGERP